MRQFSLLILICHFPLVSLIKCLNNYRIAPKPTRVPPHVSCPTDFVCFKSETVFDSSSETEYTHGCMSQKSVRKLLRGDQMGQLVNAPEDLQSAFQSSSFLVSFQYFDYHFCMSDYFLFLLISLLPVQSLNCLHGSTPLNTTKVSCPVKQTRWCYSIQVSLPSILSRSLLHSEWSLSSSLLPQSGMR
ncbi:hypothetical protein PENTCL1PPCAC_2608 [Pristionchus entomophagus]|uniref:Uncharacterized protein n=1 Tax=Pristionchus entomophagus TaxID=358040 RepID=A0AAV5SBP6_9BILA|nr:hypothetical protein PENTCL1PPCAC_2608 [Pristionchus entomophagus]